MHYVNDNRQPGSNHRTPKTPIRAKGSKAWHWLLALFARILFWRDLPELQEAGLETPGPGRPDIAWHAVAWREDPATGARQVLKAITSGNEASWELSILDLVNKYPGCRITVMSPNGGGRLTGRARRAVLARARTLLMPRGVGRQRRKLLRGAVMRAA